MPFSHSLFTFLRFHVLFSFFFFFFFTFPGVFVLVPFVYYNKNQHSHVKMFLIAVQFTSCRFHANRHILFYSILFFLLLAAISYRNVHSPYAKLGNKPLIIKMNKYTKYRWKQNKWNVQWKCVRSSNRHTAFFFFFQEITSIISFSR